MFPLVLPGRAKHVCLFMLMLSALFDKSILEEFSSSILILNFPCSIVTWDGEEREKEAFSI